MVAGARDSPAVILGVHRRPPHFAKLGRRAGPHLSPRSFPRRSRSHASEVREPGQPLVVSAFGDRDFLNDVSLPSLCRNSCGPQQEALPALHSRLLRQLRCLQVRRGSSCQPLCSKMLTGVRKALDHPAWSARFLGLGRPWLTVGLERTDGVARGEEEASLALFEGKAGQVGKMTLLGHRSLEAASSWGT